MESASIFVNGSFVSGCTHQTPLFENKTTRWPGRAPVTRPSMTSRVSGPPLSAGGSRVISIDGRTAVPGWATSGESEGGEDD